MCTVDRKLEILTFNPTAERITGWREPQVRGQCCDEVFRDAGVDGTSHLCTLIQQVLDSGQPVASTPDVPAILSRDGREVFLSSSVSPLRNREGRLVGVVRRDALLQSLIRDDAGIRTEVDATITACCPPGERANVRLAVHNGIVELTGELPSTTLARLVAEVEEITDVVEVKNLLTAA